MFFQALDSFGDQIAVIESGSGGLSYSELSRESDRFAEMLVAGEKKLIFILGRNDAATLIGYLGALKSGHAAFLIDSNLQPNFLSVLLERYRPDFSWQPRGSGSDAGSRIHVSRGYELVSLAPGRSTPIHPDLHLLLSTSGSTGSPKAVRLTSANLDGNADSIMRYLALTPHERPVTTLPFAYSYGLSVINSHLKSGATLLMSNHSPVNRDFWIFLKEERATSLSGVPFTYEILRRLDFFKMDLPFLNTLTQAGGRMAPERVIEFAEHAHRNKIRFFVMYGQTEATARISYVPAERILEKAASIGIPVPGGRLRLTAPDGSDIDQPRRIGELVYHGNNVMMGYAESADDLARDDDLHGELRTGDLGYFDEDLYFAITGRLKRFIKVFGNRVSLDDVEQFLRLKGMDCACSGRDDLLCVAAVQPQDPRAVGTIIEKTFGFHHSAIRVTIVSQIPRNPAGKVMYAELFEDA